MKLKSLAIPMAFALTLMNSTSFAAGVGSWTNTPTDCSTYEDALANMQSLAWMEKTSETQQTVAYKNSLKFYNDLYSKILYANFLQDSYAFLNLQQHFKYCDKSGQVIMENLSWDQLIERLGPEKSAELKKQLEATPGVIHGNTVMIGAAVIGIGGLTILVASGALAVGAPAVGMILLLGGAAGTGLTAFGITASYLPLAGRQILLHFDKEHRQELDQAAQKLALRQVNDFVGSGREQNKPSLP